MAVVLMPTRPVQRAALCMACRTSLAGARFNLARARTHALEALRHTHPFWVDHHDRMAALERDIARLERNRVRACCAPTAHLEGI